MASLKYRCLTPEAETKQCLIAAGATFYHNCVNFVEKNAAGFITQVTAASGTIYGALVNVPPGRGNQTTSDDYWTAPSTSTISLPIVIGVGAQFLAPCTITTTDAMKAGAWDLIGGGTAALLINTSASSTDVIIVDQLGTDIAGGGTTDAVVHINPIKFQAD